MSHWGPSWKNDVPTSGAGEAWWGFERSGGLHTREDTCMEAGMDVAPPGKLAEEGPAVSGHCVCSPQVALFVSCLNVRTEYWEEMLGLRWPRSARSQPEYSKLSASLVETKCFNVRSPVFPATLCFPSLVSDFLDYGTKDGICGKTFPFSTLVPGMEKDQIKAHTFFK